MITTRYTYAPIDRKTIDGKRHYLTPDGRAVPSVTTILDRTKSEESKAALQAWRKRVGEEEAQRITTEAAGRGTRMHKWLENWIVEDSTGEPGSNPYSQHSHQMATEIITRGLTQCDEFWGSEVPVYYPELYAGTTDLIGVWRGKPAIIDFKQSNKPKRREWIDDYFTQLAAYACAHNQVHGTDIQTGVILMAVKPTLDDLGTVIKPPEYLEFVLEGVDFANATTLWWDKVEEYHRKF